MDYPLAKMIKEEIRLDQCRADDHVHIPYQDTGVIRNFGGQYRIVKIKRLVKGMVQIKYCRHPSSSPKVFKTDVEGSLLVERERAWVPEDGEDKGFYPPALVKVDGLTYRVISPEDLAALPDRIAAAKAEDAARRKAALEAMIDDPFAMIDGYVRGLVTSTTLGAQASNFLHRG